MLVLSSWSACCFFKSAILSISSYSWNSVVKIVLSIFDIIASSCLIFSSSFATKAFLRGAFLSSSSSLLWSSSSLLVSSSYASSSRILSRMVYCWSAEKNKCGTPFSMKYLFQWSRSSADRKSDLLISNTNYLPPNFSEMSRMY